MLGVTPTIPYELDRLIGKNFQLVIVPATKRDGTPCVNVKAILAPKVGQNFKIPADFVRSKDRTNNQPKKESDPHAPGVNMSAPAATAASMTTTAPPPEIPDDDIPF
jgi:hypothetical protein